MRCGRFVSICVFAAVVAAPVFAREGEMPKMTPEQQAEMEAYVKAGADSMAGATNHRFVIVNKPLAVCQTALGKSTTNASQATVRVRIKLKLCPTT